MADKDSDQELLNSLKSPIAAAFSEEFTTLDFEDICRQAIHNSVNISVGSVRKLVVTLGRN